jgi:hypothetical protein
MLRPNFVHILTLCIAGGVLGGCTRENKEIVYVPGGGASCSSTAECPAGQVCTTNGCCPGCHSDADCGADQQCVRGAPSFCAPKNTTPPPTNVDPNTSKPPLPGSTDIPIGYACTGDSDCGRNQVCNVGRCAASCPVATACGAGESCIGGRCYAGGNACGIASVVVCTADAQCGANRACVAGKCASRCEQTAGCGLGQICANGLCKADLAPVASQCVFDLDCGVAFRCINAYCHPLCSTNEQCGSNNFCDHGVCRANDRPAT